MGKGGPGFYAVGKGRQIGIYTSWAECEANVKGFPNAKFKKFPTQEMAQDFVNQWSTAPATASYQPRANLGNPKKSYHTLHAAGTHGISGTGQRSESNSHLSDQERVQNVIASSKRRHGHDRHETELLQTPPSKLNTKKVRTDSPQVMKGMESLDGEQVYLPFIVDENETVHVFTDGACTSNGQHNAKAGVGVWFGDNHPLNISQPVDGPATNNTAEIQAARLAVEIAKKAGFSKLKINTDSAFLIQCITEWLPKWKRNGWRLAAGGDVKNRIELEKLDEAMRNITVVWNKVPAHSGVHGNEMADRLASEGAQKS